MGPIRASVIVSSDSHPKWLLKCLIGFAQQSPNTFELIIADHGVGSDSKSIVERFRRHSGLPIAYVGHDRQASRKCAILNNAICAAKSDYLIFTDADCIPRHDFVETHLTLREPGRFLSGGDVKLPTSVSNVICGLDIEQGRHADAAWLRARGFRAGRQVIKLRPEGWLTRALDLFSFVRPGWNSHNSSGWKTDLVEVNGFDERMDGGGEDLELGKRLENAGIHGKRIRYRAPVIRLESKRPSVDLGACAVNEEIRRQTKREGRVWTDHGMLPVRRTQLPRAKPTLDIG